ncbi:phospholipase-like protein [Tanacetum coccineum]
MEMANPPEIFDVKVNSRSKIQLLSKIKEVFAKLDDYDAVRVCLLVVEEDNDEMEHVMDVDNKDGKYCLDDMSIGFEEDKSNGEIKYIEGKKVNLDQCILDLMDMSEENVYNTPSLKTCFGIVERKMKPGPALQSPYEQQKPTTPPRVKRRTITSQLSESIEFLDESQFDVEEEENLESTEYDCETIPPFTEDLRRHKKCNLYKVTVPGYIKTSLKNIKSREPSKLFKLAWDPYGIVVDDQFWLAFLGLEEKKEGGSSTVTDADWALAGPHFCPAIIGGGMPIYISKAKGLYVPWTDVDKVYFPLNEPELHWALAKLHLCTGVIIIYDSMTSRKRNKNALIVEKRKWWIDMRDKMSKKLLLFLDKIGVLKRKGLTHKLPLVFNDPLQVALAYRERMLAYYWKYKLMFNIPTGEDPIRTLNMRIKRRLVFESTPHVEEEVDELHTGICAQTGSIQTVSNESGSSISNRLRTVNGKIVRSRGIGDGSRASMYPGGIKPIGFECLVIQFKCLHIQTPPSILRIR